MRVVFIRRIKWIRSFSVDVYNVLRSADQVRECVCKWLIAQLSGLNLNNMWSKGLTLWRIMLCMLLVASACAAAVRGESRPRAEWEPPAHLRSHSASLHRCYFRRNLRWNYVKSSRMCSIFGDSLRWSFIWQNDLVTELLSGFFYSLLCLSGWVEWR